MREMGPSFVTVAAQGFYRSRVRNCYPPAIKITTPFGVVIFMDTVRTSHARRK